MESKVEQVKKILEIYWINGWFADSRDYAEKIDALYTSPTPKAETHLICPKPCKDHPKCECRVPHIENEYCWELCQYHTVGHCIPVPQPEPAKDEIIQQMADYICQTFTWTCGSCGEDNNNPDPFTIARDLLAKATPMIEVLTASKYEAEIDELKGEIVNLNTQLTNEHSHYMADLEDKEARIKELESRNRSLEKDLDQLNDEYAAQHIVTSRRIQSEAREQERKEIGEYLGQRFRRYEHNDGNGIERMEFTLHRDFVDSLKRGVKP